MGLLLRCIEQPIIGRMLRHNAIEAWETMQKTAGFDAGHRCGDQAALVPDEVHQLLHQSNGLLLDQ